MASTYTTRIGLEKQADGENANTWGLRLNTNVIDLVDEATAGYEEIDISGGATTLTATDGASNQARNMGLRFTGALSADTTVTIPAEEKVYFITNDTTEDFKVLLKPAGGTLVTATDQGTSMMIATDGSIVKTLKSAAAAISATSGNFSGNVRAANFFTSATLSATDIRCETVSASTRIFTPTLTATNIVAVTSIKATRFTGGSVSVTSDVRGSRIRATSAVVSNGATINSIVITAGATITGVEKITTSAIAAVTVSATTIRTTTLSATGNVKGAVVSATSKVNTSAVVATTGKFTGIVSAAGFDANGTINAGNISATNINLSSKITATTATITTLVATTASVSVVKTGIVSVTGNFGHSLDIITTDSGSTDNYISFYKDSPSPSSNDEVQFNMDLNNNAGTRKRYSSIEAGSIGIAAGNEYSSVNFRALESGTTVTWFAYGATGVRPIHLRAATSIAGDLYVNGDITASSISAVNTSSTNITAASATITNLVATTATVSVVKTGIVSVTGNSGRSLDIITTDNTSFENSISFYKDSSSPFVVDDVNFSMDLNNDAGTRKRYSNIETMSTGIVAGNESSQILFKALDSGTTVTWFQYLATNLRPINLKATTSIGGDLNVSGTITEGSDERYKSNIQTLDGTKAFDMRGVSFERNSVNDSGVIAQELELVAPELVTTDEEGYKAVAYSHVIGYLIEAVKHLKEEVETLKGNN
jgi:hypothetical protein